MSLKPHKGEAAGARGGDNVAYLTMACSVVWCGVVWCSAVLYGVVRWENVLLGGDQNTKKNSCISG